MTMPKEPAFWSGERWQTRYVDGHWIPFTDAQQPDDALRVAQLVVDRWHEFGTDPDVLSEYIAYLAAALDGAPYEPSEEMVERAVGVFLFREKDTGGLNSRMRAALRAALSPGESPSGTGQQQTDR